MTVKTTYRIRYLKDNKTISAWTSPDMSLDDFQEKNKCQIVESNEVLVMIADDGKTLVYDDVEIGEMDIIGDKDIQRYTEIDFPIEGAGNEQAI